MVVIDLGTRILQVKLRRDVDTFSHVEIPIGDPVSPDTPPPLASASSSASGSGSRNSRLLQGGASAPDEPETVEDGSASYTHALWQCMMQGKIDFLELFAGSARLSQCAALRGLKTGSPVDLRSGFDLNAR